MDGSSDSEDEPCSSVLNRLESRDEVGRKSKQNAVTVVAVVAYASVYQNCYLLQLFENVTGSVF